MAVGWGFVSHLLAGFLSNAPRGNGIDLIVPDIYAWVTSYYGPDKHEGTSIKCDERSKSMADGAEKPECTRST